MQGGTGVRERGFCQDMIQGGKGFREESEGKVRVKIAKFL